MVDSRGIMAAARGLPKVAAACSPNVGVAKRAVLFRNFVGGHKNKGFLFLGLKLFKEV